jgi:hypothetical protein
MREVVIFTTLEGDGNRRAGQFLHNDAFALEVACV